MIVFLRQITKWIPAENFNSTLYTMPYTDTYGYYTRICHKARTFMRIRIYKYIRTIKNLFGLIEAKYTPAYAFVWYIVYCTIWMKCAIVKLCLLRLHRLSTYFFSFPRRFCCALLCFSGAQIQNKVENERDIEWQRWQHPQHEVVTTHKFLF